MLLVSDRVAKQTELLLRQMVSNCVNSGLWNTEEDDLLRMETMNLDGGSNVFSKVVCMLIDLLSARYEPVKRAVFNILGAFAEVMEESAFEYVKPLLTQL